MEVWIRFFFSATLIVLAGTRLTRSAQTLAQSTGLGLVWAGALLLPLATTLPELVTSWRAAVIQAPDLAAGNVFGSILFNLFIIALIDLAQGRGPLLPQVKKSHILTAAFSIILLAVALLGMLMPSMPGLGWVGLDTIAILIVYNRANALLLRYEKKKIIRFRKYKNLRLRQTQSNAPATAGPKKPVSQCLDNNLFPQKTPTGPRLACPLLAFLLAAAVIFWAGTSLADTADAIALQTGLSKTLIGSFLVAVTTSLPELVTTLTAIRLKVPDMAVGNIFGANLFNMVILFVSDLFFRRGPITGFLSPQHCVSAAMAIILTGVAIIGLIYPTRRSFLNMGYSSLAILFGYVLAFILLFTTGLSG